MNWKVINMERIELVLSTLRKTWIFDFDGTLVEHNGYKTGEDKLLPGVKEFFKKIPADDFIIIFTAREKEAKERTVNFIKENGLRFNEIFFEMPMGERILFNDSKPSGLKMSYSVECVRNEGFENINLKIDESL